MTDVQETRSNSERAERAQAPAPAKKPRVGAHSRHVAPSNRKRPKRATRANTADRGPTSAKPAKKGSGARQGSKTARCLALLKRPGGATGSDLMKATGWQAHSVRGFISGVLGRRMGLKVSSETENGLRRYTLKA